MVTNYNPRNPYIRKLILCSRKIISNGTDCGNLFPKPSVPGYRRLPYLRDLITNADINYPEETTQNTSYRPKNCLRFGKCTFTNTTYQCIIIPKRITCEINNIIHLITCSKCNMVYVGETYREFRKRIYEHRNSVLKPKPSRSTPVSRHFIYDKHRVSHMEFSGLELCTPKFRPNETGLRRIHELSWNFKLYSLAPLDINQHV